MESIRKRVIVRGVVQGVGFRMNARAQAVRLGLSGHARNLSDGTVQVEIEGDEVAVAAMQNWLHIGPRFADVASISVEDLAPLGDAGFDVL